MGLVLGLDSGGTKTVLAFADRSGQAILVRRGKGLDPSVDPDWAQSLTALLTEDAQVLRDAEASVLGLPFHDEVARYTQEQTAVVRSLFPGNVLVQNDVRVAFDGAMAGKPGVLVLAGTGSMAWASLNGRDDPHVRVGGWGDAFGDEGSAFWIGREALTAVSRDLDGRAPARELSEVILSALGLQAGDLIGWCYALENRRTGFAKLAVVVSALADAGNADATGILHAAGDHLATHITAAWCQTTAQAPLRWSYAGGVLACRPVLQRIIDKVGCEPFPPRLPPVGGAILRAAVNAGWAIDDIWLDRLTASLATLSHNEDHHEEGE